LHGESPSVNSGMPAFYPERQGGESYETGGAIARHTGRALLRRPATIHHGDPQRRAGLLQTGVLGFGLLEDGRGGIGVLPANQRAVPPLETEAILRQGLVSRKRAL
jgi:hypothetical protein